ncbi:hypothetical protein E4T48_03632 [Aureobasidium sp. EXF-10727]|nr:hypothetical protein E4T48_03632 [Aureobasidium sp. EXF-10727]
MGLFNRKKVDGDLDVDAPGNDSATSTTTNDRTGISRFGRSRKAAGAPSSRSTAAGLGSLKAIRFLQLLLAILILGLVAYAVNVFSATFVSRFLSRQFKDRLTDTASKLQSAYIPALVAAVLTVLVTIPLAFLPRLPGLFAHPLSAALVDLFFALFWLAIMAELAAYSDVAAPRDFTYYTGGLGQQTDGNAAYDAYSGTINRLKTAWACGAAAAAFAGLEFVLFLVSALLPLRGRFVGPVTGTDSAGVPTDHHGSALHNDTEPPFEMQTRNAGHTGPASPTSPATVHGVNNTGGVLGSGNTNTVGTANSTTFVPSPSGQYESAFGVGDRANMI